MPDPYLAAAVIALVALVESTPWIRVPIGLLLAIALIAMDADVLQVAMLGAVGVMFARLALALVARSVRDRLGAGSPQASARRDALRAHLSQSSTYARTTFTLAALPGIPAAFVFPLLGAMRAPLAPALAGTIVGRVPVLALTTALFTWVGRASTENDSDAALLLGVMAILLLVLRTINRVDWQHRTQGGGWRMREDDAFLRMVTLGEAPGAAPHSELGNDDDDIVEGELVGEEIDQDDESGDDAPRA